MANSGSPDNPISNAARFALLAQVRQLAGASVQKIWLASPSLLSLQLRTPGRSSIVSIDAERALALVADERPAAAASALKSQATLRAALGGARFDSAQLVVPLDAPDNARLCALRLELTTPRGARVLLADPRAQALVLAAREEGDATVERIIWTAPGAAAAFKPGAVLASCRALAEPPAEPHARSAPGSERALAHATVSARATERFTQDKQALVRALKAKAQKLQRTLEAVERDSARAAQAIEARKLAALLLPVQSKIPRGARVAVVPDWSQLDERGEPAQISIALDPALGAAGNASRMLKKAQRYTAAASRIAARRAEVARVHQQAVSALARAEAATSPAELASLSAPIGARAQPSPSRRAEQERLPYRAFRASNGARVLVGRSAKDNDALTLRWARGDDLWLHARGVHGSHVILVDPGPAPDARALGEAALLAAHFSSARGADGAEVSWTRRKHVRKGKGLAPGAVTFSQEKTLRVRLDEAGLQALLSREEE